MASMDNGGFPAEPANVSGSFGLFDARDFRLTDGRDDTAPATAAARWYFEREVIAVPRPGLPVAGFARRTRPLADVERWARERDERAPPDYPPLVWVAAPEVVQDARIAEDGRRLETASGSVALDLVPRIALNRSYFDASSVAFFRQRTLRARGTHGQSGFTARTLWPEDFRLGPDPPPLRALAADLAPDAALRARMREVPRGGADAPYAAETLWQRPGATGDWAGLPVLAFLCNGAQGDDDEAHAGHFAIATGRIGTHGDIGDWLVNNFYSLDVESEKGILAAPAPLDNYQGDLNAGQSWYRPTHVLVAVLDDARAAHLVQSALLRLYQQFWRHQLVYDHPRDNCTSMSVDVLRALGLPVPARGPTSVAGAFLYLPIDALRRRSLAAARTSYDYATADLTRLLPAVATEDVFAALSACVTGAAPEGRLAQWLRADLRAIALLRIPQLPSSRVFGDAPVVDLAGYRARVPRDPAQHQIVPVPPRPFPEALRDDDLLPPLPRVSALAERAWRALSLGLVAIVAILVLV
jgi:hypothetical protein